MGEEEYDEMFEPSSSDSDYESALDESTATDDVLRRHRILHSPYQHHNNDDKYPSPSDIIDIDGHDTRRPGWPGFANINIEKRSRDTVEEDHREAIQEVRNGKGNGSRRRRHRLARRPSSITLGPSQSGNVGPGRQHRPHLRGRHITDVGKVTSSAAPARNVSGALTSKEQSFDDRRRLTDEADPSAVRSMLPGDDGDFEAKDADLRLLAVSDEFMGKYCSNL